MLVPWVALRRLARDLYQPLVVSPAESALAVLLRQADKKLWLAERRVDITRRSVSRLQQGSRGILQEG